MRRRRWACFAACLGVVVLSTTVRANDFDGDEEVVFFPTCTLLDPGAPATVLPIHGWIYEPEHDSVRRRFALKSLVDALGLDDDAATARTFVDRGRWFLVDNERNQRLTIRVASRDVALPASESNGHFYAEVEAPTADLLRDARADGSLPFHVVTPRNDSRVFVGWARLIGPQGWSVVSDIDDTIKDSNVLDKQELLKNTLLRDFRAVNGMSDAYREWQAGGAVFHYVSGSPWQLYLALDGFRDEYKFPAGTFHLRHFRLQDGSARELLSAPDTHKTTNIESLLKQFPRRNFIFVGDTGERDPEIYGSLARQYPDRVRLIALRNVTDEPLDGPRLSAATAALTKTRVLLFTDAAALPKLSELDGD
jgi:hypothetical protein